MLKMITTVLLSSIAAACAYSPRSSAPVIQETIHMEIDDAASCLVQNMNSETANIIGRMGPVTHSIQITQPKTTYEIAPQQTMIVGGEYYFVRLKSDGKNTVAELFAPSSNIEVAAAVRRCAAPHQR